MGAMSRPRRLPNPRAVPWAVLIEVATVLRNHWLRLPPPDRARLGEIVRKSRGRWSNLDPHDRQELRRLVRKLEPAAIGRDLLPFARRVRGRR